MKVVFFNRFFYPDLSATSQLLTDLAAHLAGRGHEVHVVASRVAVGESESDNALGVTIHRAADIPRQSHGLSRRALAYFDYYVGARRIAKRLLAPGDLAILKTDPPLLSAAIGPLVKSRGAKVVVWLQDIFPEIAEQYGIPGARGPTGALLRVARNRSLEIADGVVTISDGMAARIAAMRCVTPSRLHVIHNWADGSAITPLEPGDNSLRERWRLAGNFVVGYSGNLGRVHEFDTILDAASRLKDQQDIQFLFIGGGSRLREVRAHAERKRLRNIRFEPSQERERLFESLCVPDVHLTVLQPQFSGLVLPSKLYGIMAAGRPAIFIGDLESDTSLILSESGAGVSIATGDGAALADQILQLRGDPAERVRIGKRARHTFEMKYDVPIAMARWDSLLKDL